MEILGKILGNPARVKIMRLFLLNSAEFFENKEIVKRSRVNSAVVRREVSLLSNVGFIKKSKQGWSFNPYFTYASQFERLLVGADQLDKDGLTQIFKKTGKIKVLIVAGKFLKNNDHRVDILIIGDKVNRKKVEDSISKLEAEIGTELTYAMFETAEFIYRLNMNDKLVRDILDFPNEIIIETKELSTHLLKKA